MEKTKTIIGMIEDLMYSEFQENSIERMNVDEVGRISDILKDLSMAVYYCTVVDGMEKTGRYMVEVNEPMAVQTEEDDTIERLNEKIHGSMSDLDRVNLRNKLQAMLHNLS